MRRATGRASKGALVAALLFAGLARSGDATEEYRQKFRDGMAHYKEGRFSQAVDHWESIAEAMGDEQAYRLLYNLGVACDELGRATRAAAYLGRFRREVARRPPADVPEEVRDFDRDASARLTRLDTSHGQVTIVPPGGEALRLRVDGEERTRDLGLAIYLVPGRHQFVMRVGSPHEETRDVWVEAGKQQRLELAPLPAPPPVVVRVPQIVTVTAPPIPAPRTNRISPWWIGVAGGATMASVALPLALRSQANATKRSYDDPDSSPRVRTDLAERYDDERTRYNLSWALPATLALGTGALIAVYAIDSRRVGRARPAPKGIAIDF